MNTLYYGDNLDVMREHVKDESVDLIYLDPPFNSNVNYNVLFKEHGTEAAAQFQAFEDTWKWDENAARAYQETVEHGGKLSMALQAFRNLVGESDMLAYLAMMSPRLVELRRVLKPSGSIYLHCDPTAGHYLKLLMDAVFGAPQFGSEIIWKRSSAHSDTKQGRKLHGHIHDCIYFYTRDENWTWNPQYTKYDEEYIKRSYRHVEEGTGRVYRLDNLTGPGGAAKGNPSYEVMGVTRYWRYSREKMNGLIEAGRIVQTNPGTVPAYKRYLDEMPGVSLQDVWNDIPPIGSAAAERLGYPTQKPLALLERIVLTSSNEGDVVLDPFCGCGTTIDAAEKLGRRWLGIDITFLATNLIKHRLQDTYGEKIKDRYEVIGEPSSVPDARILAAQDPYQFQWWALGLVGARPVEQKKGADQGIDGRLFFHEGDSETKQVILSVKGGKNVQVRDVRDLSAVVEREGAAIGVLITMHNSTKPMRAEAANAGSYTSPWGSHAKLQILTVRELLEGSRIDMPQVTGANVTFKKSSKHEEKGVRQGEFDVESY